MTPRIVVVCLVISLLAPAAVSAYGGPDQPDPSALVLVTVADQEALARFLATGVPAYARLAGDQGEQLLAGADAAGLSRLQQAGLPARLLDADTTGATYYVVYPAPGSTSRGWARYGRVLLDDGRQVVLRTTPDRMRQFGGEQAEVMQVTPDAKPLQRQAATPAAGVVPAVDAPDPFVQAMIDQVDTDVIYQYTGDLSGEWAVTVEGAPYTITTRNTLSGTPVQKATQYVGEHLAALGLPVEYHTWAPNKPPNVIGERTGAVTPGDIFLVGGHVDDMPSSGRAPGADDNASGSVGVLVAADILSQYEWGCTLRFALWTGEEQGLLGSNAYAQRAANRNENIRGVLNLDMIAWNTAGSPRTIDLHANANLPATLDLAQLFADVITVYAIDLAPQIIPNGTTASDHASFWNYGYTAILGIEDYVGSPNDFNPYYHTSNDTLARLDMSYYTAFVRAAVGAMAHMSDCLRTGQVQGQVAASHDGSPISGATVTLTRTAGYSGQALTDGAGAYGAAVPSGAYTVTVAAYGYLPATVDGVAVAGDAAVTEDFALVAAAPVAPVVAVATAEPPITLSWLHVPPNMAYEVHRSEDPYFTPASATLRATVNMPFSEPVTYQDESSGWGDPTINHFYVVSGVNAAGATAASNRVGEFDFNLIPGG